MTERHFTQDWFSYRVSSWEKYVVPNLPEAPKPVHWLEIGSFEGRSACWVIDNVLDKRPGSTLHCVDLWADWPGYQGVEARFDANTAFHPAITKIKQDSKAALIDLWRKNSQYDVIYVDADHQAKSALMDAALAWPMLKQGGIMVFDDYSWQHPPEHADRLPPKLGIDAFLNCWKNEMKVLAINWQAYIQKTC